MFISFNISLKLFGVIFDLSIENILRRKFKFDHEMATGDIIRGHK